MDYNDYLDKFKNFYSRNQVAFKILLTIVHAAMLVWACIVSFSYLGCLQSELLCPQAKLNIPFTSSTIDLPTEYPLIIPIIILSSINITYLFAVPKIHYFNYIALSICFILFLISVLLVEAYIPLEDVLLEQILTS